MRLVVDSSALALLINPGASPPIDPSKGTPTDHVQERVAALIATLSGSDVVIIPTPVLAEVLVKAENEAPAVLEQLQGQAKLRVKSFDERAAVELALMTRSAVLAGNKRDGSSEPWQKVKLDRQIVAIAKVADSTLLYSDDANLVAFARAQGMETVSTWELPVPEGASNLFTTAGLGPSGLDGNSTPRPD